MYAYFPAFFQYKLYATLSDVDQLEYFFFIIHYA